MLSYHNDPQLKEQFISLLRWHQEQDKIIRGTYWDNYTGRACAIGCSINSLRIITKRTDIDHSDHAAYEELIGVPRVLARLEDGIFENLPHDKAMQWPIRFAESIPVGVDLSLVWPQFAVWLMDTLLPVVKDERARVAVEKVRSIYQRIADGAQVPDSDIHDAALDARAALDALDARAALDALDARAARAALDALDARAALDALDALDARHDLYEAAADKLVELISASHPLGVINTGNYMLAIPVQAVAIDVLQLEPAHADGIHFLKFDHLRDYREYPGRPLAGES